MSTIKFIRFVLFAAITLLVSQSSHGQSLNLDLGTIKGESLYSLHPNTIDCNSYSLSCTNSGSGVVFGDLVVTKSLDKSSPQLFGASAGSTNIPSATLYLSKIVSSNPVDYYIIKLTNAKVSSISQSGTPDSRPNETITFKYQKIELDYIAYNAQGQPQPAVVMKWDLTTNSTF